MYEELVERLRKTYTVCGWDDLKSAADAIEALESELDRLRREKRSGGGGTSSKYRRCPRS